MTYRDGKCCEHCLIGGTVLTMMGNARVYECELGYRNSDKDCCIGFFEPCDYYPNCFTPRSVWLSKNNRPAEFKYKRISKSQMKKSDRCLREEKEERERNAKERERLQNEAFDLLKRAERLK